MKKLKNTSGYSIIASIMMIGFLLILTTSTLNLALQEMNDGRGRQNYLKAFAGAEGSLELALLKIKQEGFGYDEDNFSGSLLGSSNLDAEIFYDFDSKVSAYTGVLDSFSTEIIPLFSIDSSGFTTSTTGINLSSSSSSIAWNIIGSTSGLSGSGSFISNDIFTSKSIGAFSDLSVSSFLSTNTGSYLTLSNTSNVVISYSIVGNGGEIYFSKPKSEIFSSARVGKYSQNLRTGVDNTEFLGVLKYSVYSGN